MSLDVSAAGVFDASVEAFFGASFHRSAACCLFSSSVSVDDRLLALCLGLSTTSGLCLTAFSSGAKPGAGGPFFTLRPFVFVLVVVPGAWLDEADCPG